MVPEDVNSIGACSRNYGGLTEVSKDGNIIDMTARARYTRSIFFSPELSQTSTRSPQKKNLEHAGTFRVEDWPIFLHDAFINSLKLVGLR